MKNNTNPREGLLWLLLNKVLKEYKTLLQLTKRSKTFKVVEIIYLSSIPGETIFSIQVTNKNSIMRLSAAEIISGYDLDDFYDYHADMIRQAAQGKLVEFLKLSEVTPSYKIISKKYERDIDAYLFTLEDREHVRFVRTAEQISQDHDLLMNLNISDIYDVGYVQGAESILKEKSALLLAKKNKFSVDLDELN